MPAKATNTLRIENVYIRWVPDEDADTDEQYGCTAYATVSYAIGGQGDRRLETLSSGGLWGIDQPDASHRHDCEQGQLDDLRDHLSHFGLTVTDAEWATVAGEVIRS